MLPALDRNSPKRKDRKTVSELNVFSSKEGRLSSVEGMFVCFLVNLIFYILYKCIRYTEPSNTFVSHVNVIAVFKFLASFFIATVTTAAT